MENKHFKNQNKLIQYPNDSYNKNKTYFEVHLTNNRKSDNYSNNNNHILYKKLSNGLA